MNNPTINLTTGVQANSQIPTNGKGYSVTLESLADLGPSNANAFRYYDGMIVMCAEDKKMYIWREQNNYEAGLVENGYTYPTGVSANGINYGGKKYNWFEYKAASENDDLFVYGGIVYYEGPGFQYVVSTASVLNYEDETFFVPQTPLVLDDADPVNDRFDIFILNLTSRVFQVVKGTASENPQIPVYDRNTQILLSTVRVSAGSTNPGITKITVYDEFLQQDGGEFDVSASSSDPVYVLNADSNSFPGIILDSGSICILYDYRNEPPGGNGIVTFSKNVDTDASLVTQLVFALRTKAPFNILSELEVFMVDENDQIVSNIVEIFSEIPLNFQSTNYQDIVIPWEMFDTTSFRKIIMRMKEFKDEIFIDNVRLLAGQSNMPINNTYLGLDDTEDITYQEKENYVPTVEGNKLKLKIPNVILLQEGLVHKINGNQDLSTIENGDICFGIEVFDTDVSPTFTVVLPKAVFDENKGSGNPLNKDSYIIKPISN
jgi:hypothetical protein